MKVTPKNRAAWRKWLAANHAETAEVWVVFYKKHTGKPSIRYSDAVEEALCFGWIDGVIRRIDDDSYMHRFSPRRPDSRWSATNRKRAGELIESGLMTPAGQRAIDQAKRAGRWTDSQRPKVDLKISPAFAAALESNEEAARQFAMLSAREQNLFVGWINLAKREATRERRITESLRLLERGEKLGLK